MAAARTLLASLVIAAAGALAGSAGAVAFAAFYLILIDRMRRPPAARARPDANVA